MSPSPSLPQQTPVTTVDEPHTRAVKSPLRMCLDTSAEHPTQQPDSPSSSSQSRAPHTPPVSSSLSRTLSASTPMSAIQSKSQPNPTSQNMSTASISINSNPSCLTLPEPTAPLQSDQPVKPPSQPLDSGIVDPASLPVKSRQSITPSFSFPGASNSATTYDSIFPDSADSYCTLTPGSSTESISSQRMPNVYINGLPPHFSEQDLFALTRPFGDIKSVRTFTRHVSEKPTGYGFVLFNDLDSAQRCIEGLRKCRNLHPSFSKQVHRIPGTEYAQHNAPQSTDQDENTFKMRMEKLKDNTSTNLYIEGLPLSIDEESLTALMKPHKIKSSRFFKTKLSNPPRIIAFVRLETRVAAEETIEQLHGRMVRGWNDPGCRISVRFADSAEQRELRRAERTLKNGDQSPARLTIAQASLLNLRGQELQANMQDVAGGKPQRGSIPRFDNQATTSIPGSDSVLLPASRSLPSKLCYTYGKSPSLSASDLPNTSEMNSLLRSIHNMGYDDGSLDSTMRASTLDNEFIMSQQAQLQALASVALPSPNQLMNPITLPRGHAQARNGFTPAEELILEAHAQRLQLQTQLSQSSPIFEPMPSLRKLNSSVSSFDPAFHEPFPASGLARRAMFSPDTLPTISEDDFHAMGHPPRSFVPTSHGLVDNRPPNAPITTSTILVRPPNRAVSIVPPPPDYEEPGKRSKGHQQRVERSIGSKQTTYSSSFNIRQSTPSGESKSPPSLLQASTCPNDISSNNSNDSNSNTSIISRDKNIELQHTYMYSHRGYPEEDKAPPFHPLPASQIYGKKSPRPGEQHSAVKEGPKSPAVVSPALTYSSRTPSTLSPATPFFGSFVGGQAAFEVMTMENEDVAERKLKARVASK